MKLMRRLASVGIVLALLGTSTGPALAGAGDVLVSKRLYAGVGIGVTALFLKEAYSARRDGGDYYDLYRTAGSTQRATELYNESRRLDTRSAVLLAAGLGTLGVSVHLLLSDRSVRKAGKAADSLLEIKGLTVDVGADPVRGSVRVGLSRGF
jgi:hypothetical protein